MDSFSEFLEFCRGHLESHPDLVKLIEKRYRDCSLTYTTSSAFSDAVCIAQAKIDSDSKNIYVYLRDFLRELKANKSDDKARLDRKRPLEDGDSGPNAKQFKHEPGRESVWNDSYVTDSNISENGPKLQSSTLSGFHNSFEKFTLVNPSHNSFNDFFENFVSNERSTLQDKTTNESLSGTNSKADSVETKTEQTVSLTKCLANERKESSGNADTSETVKNELVASSSIVDEEKGDGSDSDSSIILDTEVKGHIEQTHNKINGKVFKEKDKHVAQEEIIHCISSDESSEDEEVGVEGNSLNVENASPSPTEISDSDPMEVVEEVECVNKKNTTRGPSNVENASPSPTEISDSDPMEVEEVECVSKEKTTKAKEKNMKLVPYYSAFRQVNIGLKERSNCETLPGSPYKEEKKKIADDSQVIVLDSPENSQDGMNQVLLDEPVEKSPSPTFEKQTCEKPDECSSKPTLPLNIKSVFEKLKSEGPKKLEIINSGISSFNCSESVSSPKSPPSDNVESVNSETRENESRDDVACIKPDADDPAEKENDTDLACIQPNADKPADEENETDLACIKSDADKPADEEIETDLACIQPNADKPAEEENETDNSVLKDDHDLDPDKTKSDVAKQGANNLTSDHTQTGESVSKENIDNTNISKSDDATEFPEQMAASSSGSKTAATDQTDDQDVSKEKVPKKKGSKRQIERLEKLLEDIKNKIEELRRREVSLEELDDEESAYILEDRYQKKFVKVWNKLCELKECSTSTGRPVEKRFCYEGTRYPEINRKVERFINKRKVFPDFHDIRNIVAQVNLKHSLGLRTSAVDSLAKEAFTDVGLKLQVRRRKDLRNSLLDHELMEQESKPEVDPASKDVELKKKLDENKRVSKSKLEEVLQKYVNKQNEKSTDNELEDDNENEDQSQNSEEEEVDVPEMEKIIQEDEVDCKADCSSSECIKEVDTDVNMVSSVADIDSASAVKGDNSDSSSVASSSASRLLVSETDTVTTASLRESDSVTKATSETEDIHSGEELGDEKTPLYAKTVNSSSSKQEDDRLRMPNESCSKDSLDNGPGISNHSGTVGSSDSEEDDVLIIEPSVKISVDKSLTNQKSPTNQYQKAVSPSKFKTEPTLKTNHVQSKPTSPAKELQEAKTGEHKSGSQRRLFTNHIPVKRNAVSPKTEDSSDDDCIILD